MKTFWKSIYIYTHLTIKTTSRFPARLSSNRNSTRTIIHIILHMHACSEQMYLSSVQERYSSGGGLLLTARAEQINSKQYRESWLFSRAAAAACTAIYRLNHARSRAPRAAAACEPCHWQRSFSAASREPKTKAARRDAAKLKPKSRKTAARAVLLSRMRW